MSYDVQLVKDPAELELKTLVFGGFSGPLHTKYGKLRSEAHTEANHVQLALKGLIITEFYHLTKCATEQSGFLMGFAVGIS